MFGNGFFIDSMEGVGYWLNLLYGVFVLVVVSYDVGCVDENCFDLLGFDYLKGMGWILGLVFVGVCVGVMFFDMVELSVMIDMFVMYMLCGVLGYVDFVVLVFKML